MLKIRCSKNLQVLSKNKGEWNDFKRLTIDEFIPEHLWDFFGKRLTVRQAINTDAEKLAIAVNYGAIKLNAQTTIKFLEKEEEKELATGINNNFHLREVKWRKGYNEKTK